MPAERLSMRKVREVLHLKHALGMSYRRISSATGASKDHRLPIMCAEPASVGSPC